MSTVVIEKPKIEIAPDLLAELKQMTQEQGQVIVHCLCASSLLYPMFIRIWKTTFLFDKNGSHRSELVHADNISIAPTWTEVAQGSIYHFSLVFTGLPKSCEMFDLIEVITEPGAFKVSSIKRNSTDVYYVRIA